MGDLGNVTGNKPKYAREVDSDNWQDTLGLTAAQAAKFSVVSAKSVVNHNDGTKKIVFEAVCPETTLTLTDYAAMGIGSKIFHTGKATPTVYVKCADSSPAVVGDWYLEELTQAT